jgi:hypothetical protein
MTVPTALVREISETTGTAAAAVHLRPLVTHLRVYFSSGTPATAFTAQVVLHVVVVTVPTPGMPGAPGATLQQIQRPTCSVSSSKIMLQSDTLASQA